MTHQSALYMQVRIRAVLASGEADFLHGILEADETYIGGKPCKCNKRDDDDNAQHPRGRSTRKAPIIGAVERGGGVCASCASLTIT